MDFVLDASGSYTDQVSVPVSLALTITKPSGSTLVSWTAVANVISYDVWIGPRPANMVRVATLYSGTSYLFTNLVSGMPYFIQIVAVLDDRTAISSAVTTTIG